MEHNNNWAVLVCTSTFWFNYRHVANVLSVYHIIKKSGIPDDHIILMLADDMACNARNTQPATVFNHFNHYESSNVYDDQVEVDYRGSEVTVDNLIRLLTNRLPSNTPQSKRLLSDEKSNILIYMTGHGGDNFLKFQDTEEMNAHDLASSLHQMHEGRRYNEILLIIDTCQASTMYEHLEAPKIVAIASSVKGESSYSYHGDEDLGLTILDRFTWALLEFFRKNGQSKESGSNNSISSRSLGDLYEALDPDFLHSHPFLKLTVGSSGLDAKVLSFFGNQRAVEFGIEPLHFDIDFRYTPRNRFTLAKGGKKSGDVKLLLPLNNELNYVRSLAYAAILSAQLFMIVKLCKSWFNK